MNNLIGHIALFSGLAFILVGCIGVLRFPDVFSRMQVASKCITLGACGILLGAMLIAGASMIAVKCAVCIGVVLITAPAAAHAIARGAQVYGEKFWKKPAQTPLTDDITDTDQK